MWRASGVRLRSSIGSGGLGFRVKGFGFRV